MNRFDVVAAIIVKDNKSEFAYPSTSLYVESMPK